MQLHDFVKKDGILETEIRDMILKDVQDNLERTKNEVGDEGFKMLQKQILLQVVDHCWSSHLSTLDHLRSVIGFRGYAQRDPLNEYKQEAFIMFEEMMERIRFNITKIISFIEIKTEAPPPEKSAPDVSQSNEKQCESNEM